MDVSPIILLAAFAPTILIIFVNQKVVNHKHLNFFNIPYYLAPLIGTVIIFVLGVISLDDIYRAITGASFERGLEFIYGTGPFSIAVLFLSMTFIAITLDVAGFFEYIAVKVLERVQTSGRKIFISIYLLTSVLTLFTSNDILILTLTPFLIVFLRHLRLNPIPYLLAEFFGANILSMALLVGDPTNIIVGTSGGINFAQYAQIMIIPGFIAASVTFIILYWIFKNDIDVKCVARQLPKVSLNIWSVMTLTILVLALASMSYFSLYAIPLWHIALAWAAITFVVVCIPQHLLSPGNSFFSKSIKKMPWEIIPFILGFFILVEGFSVIGFTKQSGVLLETLVNSNPSLSVFLVGITSTITANIFNNIPMTVFFSNVIQNIGSESARTGAYYALAMGSNLGANLTPIGALAGIMWMKMLKQNSIEITFVDFVKYGSKVTLITALVTLLSIVILLG